MLPDGLLRILFFFSFSFFRKTNEGLLTDARQHRIIRSSPTRRREFVPFLALVLVVLAILAYYLGTTQRFTIQGIKDAAKFR